MLTISCTINDRPHELTIDPRTSLLDLLRNQGLTSVKQGCGVGECGACTVLVDDVAVNACLYLATWVHGKRIRTVEGEVRDGRLSSVQQAYVDAGAVQCGFCTPGLIMTTTAFVRSCRKQGRDPEDITPEDIRRAHAGNLCRCTGYETIVQAVRQALEQPDSSKMDTESTPP
ncbi:xanthine dehydrogenase iron sulfur-binding subunit XdhC [Desulfonatronum thioautotrophicum]|uniref:xanthine dehydrogenase iron sulfur-binding subunit XdhC n=1 Tax=Desulfonatronum thioautotrophicum TaxID=617001 RepID=UPI0005EBDC15|nr:xanthine dehydrogenase iron sulfur-binding subunit XdhC [Desulfonatronum thioautotrophicum]